jgi:hypothetical protein
MTRFRCAAALLTLAISSVTAAAADTPLTLFGNEADVVVRIKAPEETVKKLASMVDKIQEGMGGLVEQNGTQSMGALIKNPALVGVDRAKDWYIGVFTNGTDDEPSVVFAVQTTDADAAAESLGEEMHSKTVGDWFFYSDDEEALPEDSAPAENIAGVMKGEPAKTFDGGDIAVFINLAHLSEEYSEQIDQGKAKMMEALEQAGSRSSPGIDMKAIGEMYGKLFDAAKDGEQCTIATNIFDDGISFEDYLTFDESSETAKALAGQPKSEMKYASKLPADAIMIFGFSADMQKMMKWGASFSSMYGENSPIKKSMEDFAAGSKDIKFGSVVGSVSMAPSDSGILRSVVVAEVSPAEKYRDLYRKIIAGMGSVETNGVKQETTIQQDAESVGSSKVDVVTVKQEVDENVDPTGMMKQTQKVLFGEDGMISRLVYQKDRLVQTMGGGKEAMQAAVTRLDASTPGASVSPRKGLIPQPNILVLVDVPGLAIQALKAAAELPGLPIPINAASLNSVKLEKSYMGFSAAMDKNAIRSKSRIPVQQFKDLAQIVFLVQQMQGGGR